MKKSILASAIALALAGSPVWATTTTIKGEFILDTAEVKAGGRVNLSLLGLDETGAVDRFGEQQGAVIMAVVNSIKGTVVGLGGEDNNQPGSTPTDERPAKGEFASSVAYVRLMQGNGRVHIDYPTDASGEDTITVFLQERAPSTGGGIEFKKIGTEAKRVIKITPPSTNPEQLDIVAFNPAPADTHPKASGVTRVWDLSNVVNGSGIAGEMTAGTDGAQITVVAKNPEASGKVTLTLSLKGSNPIVSHTYEAKMIQGQAIFTLDNKVTKSGDYYLKASFDGFSGDSIDLVYPDVVKVHPTGIPRGISATSTKSRVVKPSSGVNANLSSTPNDCQAPASNANFPVCQGTAVTINLLDEFGNPTSNRAGAEIKLQAKDANKVIASSALDIYVPAGESKAVSKTGDLIIGNNKDEFSTTADVGSSSSLAVTALDSSDLPIATITPSQPLSIQLVGGVLNPVVHADFLASPPPKAGEEFYAFTIGVKGSDWVDKTTDPGTILIKNAGTSEEIAVNRKTDGSNVVQSLFTKSSTNKSYLLSDKAGVLGQVLIDANSIESAAAVKVELRNAHGGIQNGVIAEKIDTPSIASSKISSLKQYTVTIPEVAFKMFDSFGNAVTVTGGAITEEATGTFTVKSSNAETTFLTESGKAYGVPGRDQKYYATVTYDATGAKKFAGEDSIGVQFTKPGLGNANLNVHTIIPAVQALTKISPLIEQSDIPVNSEVALTVNALDQNEKTYVDPDPTKNLVVKVEINKLDALTPTTANPIIVPTVSRLKDGKWIPINSGESINFSEAITEHDVSKGGYKGREVFLVNAGANVGQFSLTFSDANNTVTATKVFNVTQSLVKTECSPAPAAAGMEVCATESTCADAKGVWVPSSGMTVACNEAPTANNSDNLANMLGGEGKTIDAKFYGGISMGDKFADTVSVTKAKTLTFAGNIQIPKDHQGKKAKLLLVVGMTAPDQKFSDASKAKYLAYDGSKKEFFEANLYADSNGTCAPYDSDKFDNDGKQKDGVKCPVWTDVLAQLTTASFSKEYVTLGTSTNMEIYNGTLDIGLTTGTFYVYFGYALEAGTIVYNSKALTAELTN